MIERSCTRLKWSQSLIQVIHYVVPVSSSLEFHSVIRLPIISQKVHIMQDAEAQVKKWLPLHDKQTILNPVCWNFTHQCLAYPSSFSHWIVACTCVTYTNSLCMYAVADEMAASTTNNISELCLEKVRATPKESLTVSFQQHKLCLYLSTSSYC